MAAPDSIWRNADEAPPKQFWQLHARIRRNAFGWKSQPAITRVAEAIAEIRTVAKTNPPLAAEWAVLPQDGNRLFGRKPRLLHGRSPGSHDDEP
jgi:hypothetical protein